MKKVYLVLSLFLVGILMSSSLVSAGWFSDLFNRDKNLVGQAYPITTSVKEQVKCVFADSTTEQICYSAKGKCKGVETCIIYVSGKKGEQVAWKSTCGGYAYTTMDGQNDVAEFKCTQDVKETVKCVMWGANSSQECYSEKGSCKGKVQRDSTGRTYVSCEVEVSGKKGEQVAWKSSCRGYAYTIIDGQNDVAEFKCGIIEMCINGEYRLTNLRKGHYFGIEKCSDGVWTEQEEAKVPEQEEATDST